MTVWFGCRALLTMEWMPLDTMAITVELSPVKLPLIELYEHAPKQVPKTHQLSLSQNTMLLLLNYMLTKKKKPPHYNMTGYVILPALPLPSVVSAVSDSSSG